MKNYRVTYQDGSTRLVDGQDVVSWHHGDVTYIEREDVVRVSPEEMARKVDGRAVDAMAGKQHPLQGHQICKLWRGALWGVVEELEGSQSAKEQAQ